MAECVFDNRRSTACARMLLGALWGTACLLVLAAPLAGASSQATVSSSIRTLFAPVCHQLPDRSFALLGYPWAVCHRCAGIYLGLLAACLFPAGVRFAGCTPPLRRAWMAAGTVPILADALLPFASLWRSTPASRFSTGFCLGLLLSTLVVVGVSELLQQILMRRAVCTTMNHGGRS